jgi:hypothetical protein
VRWARVWHHRTVLDAARAIAAHRGDQIGAFFVTAWEDEDAYRDLQRRPSQFSAVMASTSMAPSDRAWRRASCRSTACSTVCSWNSTVNRALLATRPF